MESIENQLFDLLESYSFEALNEDDRLFVLSQMTEAEFRTQQKVMVATDHLIYPMAVPLPLKLPSKKSGFLLTPIPLYKSLIASAAAALLMFFFWPREETPEKIVYVENDHSTDTVFKTKIIHDTLYEVKKGSLLAVNTKLPDTVYVYSESSDVNEPSRKLKASNSIPLPELNEAQLKNNGKSQKDEDHSNLLPAISAFGSK